MEFCKIKLDKLILLKVGERTERGEIVNLARNISKNGLLVPFTVKSIANTDRYEVISGTKRFYACRIAGLTTVPAYVIDLPAPIARVIIRKGERQDLFDEAEEIRSAILNDGMSAEEFAEVSGYTEKEILSYLRLTKLGDFEREMVRRNDISLETASEIAVFDDICRRTELFSQVVHSRLKPSEVHTLCERQSRPRANRSPKFRDMRLFDNTITRAIKLLTDAGVKAKMNSERVSGGTEYKIRIEN